MAVTLKNEDGIISFYDDVNETPKYQVSHNLAREVRMEGDDACSEVVMQMLFKTWCPTEALYEYASMVKDAGLDQNIDWYATFKIVERGDYLDEANELKDFTKGDNQVKNMSFTDLTDRIRFNAEDEGETSQPIIEGIVHEKLAFYNLL